VVSQGPSFSRTGTIAGAGAFDDMNAGFRHYMEDASVILPAFASPAGEKAFVAVYDGHGGRQAVDYIVSKLHDVLLSEMESEPVVEKALVNTFHKVDGQLRLVGCFHTGSTATVAIVSRERQKTSLVLANVGDSRAIAVRRDGHVSLTPDHKAVDPAEVQRIQQSGGSVHRGRVGGQLLVSRALGDIGLKSAGVIATPHTQTRDATDDLALIIASDGVWDVVPEQTAAQIVQSVAERELSAGNKNASKAATVAAERLVECAKQKGSGDNITALVLFY
jgi:serine/threonine protein phosphatase PrpC